MDERRDLKASFSELSGRLIRVQDQERRRIARDLHDNMGQMVALLKINLDGLAKQVNLSPGPEKLLSDSLSLVETMSKELRTISYLLHPPLLDEVGLVSALHGLVDGFSERSGIDVSLQIDDKLGRLSGEVEISIYRIVQESLTNVHRHSGSRTARIHIELRPSEIQIQIQDDGKGMSPENGTTWSGVGLGGMRERATQLGGTLDINSDGKGTTVIARLPLSNESASGMDAAK